MPRGSLVSGAVDDFSDVDLVAIVGKPVSTITWWEHLGISVEAYISTAKMAHARLDIGDTNDNPFGLYLGNIPVLEIASLSADLRRWAFDRLFYEKVRSSEYLAAELLHIRESANTLMHLMSMGSQAERLVTYRFLVSACFFCYTNNRRWSPKFADVLWDMELAFPEMASLARRVLTASTISEHDLITAQRLASCVVSIFLPRAHDLRVFADDSNEFCVMRRHDLTASMQAVLEKYLSLKAVSEFFARA